MLVFVSVAGTSELKYTLYHWKCSFNAKLMMLVAPTGLQCLNFKPLFIIHFYITYMSSLMEDILITATLVLQNTLGHKCTL